MLDPRQHPAFELVKLYHQRWEIESAYFEIKKTMLGRRVLRARTLPGITQEIYALLQWSEISTCHVESSLSVIRLRTQFAPCRVCGVDGSRRPNRDARRWTPSAQLRSGAARPVWPALPAGHWSLPASGWGSQACRIGVSSSRGVLVGVSSWPFGRDWR